MHKSFFQITQNATNHQKSTYLLIHSVLNFAYQCYMRISYIPNRLILSPLYSIHYVSAIVVLWQGSDDCLFKFGTQLENVISSHNHPNHHEYVFFIPFPEILFRSWTLSAPFKKNPVTNETPSNHLSPSVFPAPLPSPPPNCPSSVYSRKRGRTRME